MKPPRLRRAFDRQRHTSPRIIRSRRRLIPRGNPRIIVSLQPSGTRSVRNVDFQLNISSSPHIAHDLRERADHGRRLYITRDRYRRNAPCARSAKLDIPRQRSAGVKDRDIGHRGETAAGKLLEVVVLRRRRGHEPRRLGGGRLHDRTRIEQAHRLQRKQDERQKRRQQKSGLDRGLRPVLARDINRARCLWRLRRRR